MRPVFQIAVLFGLLTPLGFAATWSGNLVDAGCYTDLEENTNPTNTLQNVNRDRTGEIRYCAPKPKTKSFTLVQLDGQSLNLDAAGNAKAAEFVRSLGKKHFYPVNVTGELNGKEIRVDSISAWAQR